MPKLKTKNNFLYFLFPPWAKPKWSVSGMIAEIFFFIAIISIISGFTNDYLNWKTALASGIYAVLKNFV